MKLSNFFNSNHFYLVKQKNQTPLHGVNQNMKAIDIYQDNSNVGIMIAPCDGEVVGMWGSGRQSYFNFVLEDNSLIQVVHAKPYRIGKFKKGENLAQTTWHHYHVAINTGGWNNILEYMDRSLVIKPALGLAKKWTNWATYPDKQLNISINQPKVGDTYTQDELRQAIEWNDNTAKFNLGGENGKVMNKVDSPEMESLLVNIWRLNFGVIQGTKLQNNSRTEQILEKNIDYLKATTHV
jgi:hypothetical protein